MHAYGLSPSWLELSWLHRPLLADWNSNRPSYERELEWHPESNLEWQPSGLPPVPPLPPTFRERVKQWLTKAKEKLVQLWHWLPGRAALGMMAVWLFLAAFTVHIGGAYVSRWVDHPFQAFLIVTGLAVGGPLLLAPRPDRTPIGLGIVLNLLALLVLGLLTKPTATALAEHGDWDVRWLEQRGQRGPLLWGAKAVTSISAWGVGAIPPDLLEQAIGPVSLEEVRGPGSAGRGNGNPARTSAAFAEGMGNGAAGTPSLADEAQVPGGNYLTKADKRLALMLNRERVRNGLEEIRLDERLSRVAQSHSQSMLSRGYFEHQGHDGKGPTERVRQAGLEGRVDEALARVEASKDPANGVKLALLADASERDMLLNPESGRQGMGIGIVCDEQVCLGTVLFLRGTGGDEAGAEASGGAGGGAGDSGGASPEEMTPVRGP